MFYVVLIAMVACFLALRLYMVLGKRTGHEQPLTRPVEERIAVPAVKRTIEVTPEPRTRANPNIDTKAEPGLRQIVAADSGFDVMRFLDGAQSAYRMVLEAFWKGDEEALGWLVEPAVLDSFSGAIAARTTAGHVLDNRLIGIERAVVADAGLDGRAAQITVRFDADIAAVTHDAEGVLVAGSMSDAVQTHDLWTFTRVLKSDDPNWKLSETDEA